MEADIQWHWFVGVSQCNDNLYGTSIASQIGRQLFEDDNYCANLFEGANYSV